MDHSEIDCIVQARMGSSRLHGKVMAKADDEHVVFDYLINQLKHSKLIQKIIIATTTNKEDDLIVKFAKKNQIEFFRGKEDGIITIFEILWVCGLLFSVIGIAFVVPLSIYLLLSWRMHRYGQY